MRECVPGHQRTQSRYDSTFQKNDLSPNDPLNRILADCLGSREVANSEFVKLGALALSWKNSVGRFIVGV